MKQHALHLIRHGEKEPNAGDPPLTERGRRQARMTAVHLASMGSIGRIFTSPLLRTKQTAEILAKELKREIVESHLLLERANWGDIRDQSLEEFIAMWVYASSNRDWKPPLGDSSRAAGERLKHVLKEVSGDGNDLVFVTHGGIITDFLRNTFDPEILNTHLDEFSEQYEERIPSCSITTLQYEDGKYTLVRLASIDHLQSEE